MAIESDTVESVPPGTIVSQGNDPDSHTQDEESPLLPRPDTETELKAVAGVGTIIAVLLLGKRYRHTR